MPVSFSVHSNIRDYDVFIQSTPDFIAELAHHQQTCFVVDKNVWDLYAATLLKDLPAKEVIILPISEERKNLDTVQELFDRFVTLAAKRNLTMVSIGGGILQDITGFAASTIYRGIHWIYLPTTLLAQADSCIGSKTSLNYGGYKNLIGTFYPPAQIHIYTPFLKTQEDPDFYSGFGEIIKLHLMGGDVHYREITKNISPILTREPDVLIQAIQTSLNVKLSYMAGDEFDMGRRNLLNYGHDFGHALESTSNFAVPHGQAVIFGMLAANIIAQKRGLLEEELEKDIANNLLLPSLVTHPDADAMNAEAIINAMKKDKKRTGDKLALIMMDSEFNFMRTNDLTPEEVVTALSILEKQLARPKGFLYEKN